MIQNKPFYMKFDRDWADKGDFVNDGKGNSMRVLKAYKDNKLKRFMKKWLGINLRIHQVKVIKLIFILLFPFMCYSQKVTYVDCTGCYMSKKPKQHDSTWFERSFDTTYGTIKYNITRGNIVRGEGRLVHYKVIEWRMKVPQIWQIVYDEKGQEVMRAGSGGMGTPNQDYTWGYINTSTGYKKVEEQFEFTPKTK